ncbi:transposase [Sorangium sp. So ce1078]|uniref:transposase n=1 Tax=Sorangium sp. So ce1078 TaxID=3133329 RepID=UPI003F629517
MCATAANLIEDVLPEVALRQWVLTSPFSWQRRPAEDGALFGALTRIFVESVERFYQEREKRRGVRGAAKRGAVTVVQRTSSDMRLNPHLHVVFLDGAYHEGGTELVWNELGNLQTREVGQVLEHAVGRMIRYLSRHFGLPRHASSRCDPASFPYAPGSPRTERHRAQCHVTFA